MEELKNFTLKQSKNSDNINNLNEFTFKKSVFIDNSKYKLSIMNNMDMEEMDQINNIENTGILSLDKKNKRDPLVHDYPLEITHSLGDDYSKLNNNNFNNENIPEIDNA